jgi:site-specific DNA recombinase
MPEPEPWGVCVRISRASDGSTLGVERQEPPTRALVERLGGQVVRVYVRNDTSGFDARMFPFEDALADLAAGEVRGLAAWQADRFTRRTSHALRLLDAVEQTGGRLATVTGPVDLTTAAGRYSFRNLANLAEFESDLKAERLRLKHEELAARGRHHGGPRPFGYERDGMTVIEAEAKLIREAARRLLNGESVYGILADWERLGIRSPKGNLWLATSLRNMLTSPRIAGLRVHQGEVVGPAAWPPILDRGTWEAVRRIFADRSGRRRLGRGRTFLLTGGTARCGAPGEASIGHVERICGKALVSCVNKAASYGCRPEAPHHGCGRVYAQRNHLEAFVTEMVIVALSGPGLAEARRAAAGNDQHLAALTEELRADEQALTQLARDHYVDRLISRAEFLATRQAIEAWMEATHRALSERPRTGILLDVPSTEAELRKAWKTWTVDRRHAVVAAVLPAVVVGPARRGKRFDADRVRPIWRV